MLSEVARPNTDGTLVVSEGQVPPGPINHWLCFDKQVKFIRTAQKLLSMPIISQVLKFDVECYEGSEGEKRECHLYYYLEDDSMQVVEPKVANSGCYQGL